MISEMCGSFPSDLSKKTEAMDVTEQAVSPQTSFQALCWHTVCWVIAVGSVVILPSASQPPSASAGTLFTLLYPLSNSQVLQHLFFTGVLKPSRTHSGALTFLTPSALALSFPSLISEEEIHSFTWHEIDHLHSYMSNLVSRWF